MCTNYKRKKLFKVVSDSTAHCKILLLLLEMPCWLLPCQIYPMYTHSTLCNSYACRQVCVLFCCCLKCHVSYHCSNIMCQVYPMYVHCTLHAVVMRSVKCVCSSISSDNTIGSHSVLAPLQWEMISVTLFTQSLQGFNVSVCVFTHTAGHCQNTQHPTHLREKNNSLKERMSEQTITKTSVWNAKIE